MQTTPYQSHQHKRTLCLKQQAEEEKIIIQTNCIEKRKQAINFYYNATQHDQIRHRLEQPWTTAVDKIL